MLFRLAAVLAVAVVTARIAAAIVPPSGGADAPARTTAYVGDDIPAAVATDGHSLFIAVRDLGTEGAAGLRLFKVRDKAEELPALDGAATLEDGLPVGLDMLGNELCVAFSTRRSPGPAGAGTVRCLRDGAWASHGDVQASLDDGEWVDGLAVRRGRMYVSVARPRPRSQRFLRLDGGSWTHFGPILEGRNLIAGFNPDGPRDDVSISYERSLRRGAGERRIEQLGERSRRRLAPRIEAPYGAQTGPAARLGRRWFITESRSIDRRPFSFTVHGTRHGRWVALPPGNIIRSRRFAQGGVGRGAKGSLWVAWSEQGTVSANGVPVSVYAARLIQNGRAVGRVRQLWRGSVGGFPPVPRVVAAGGRTYAVFERPARRGRLQTDVFITPLEGARRPVVLPE